MYEREGQSTKRLGYGLVSRIDPATGNIAASLTVGDDHFSSDINGASFVDGARTCVGWTAWDATGGLCRAWFCRLDANASAALQPPSGAAAAAAGARPRGAALQRPVTPCATLNPGEGP